MEDLVVVLKMKMMMHIVLNKEMRFRVHQDFIILMMIILKIKRIEYLEVLILIIVIVLLMTKYHL
ncbi:hypothetical protein MPC1_17580001 [Methylocella tundrae]|nr:hypothetical protein MPC1_17580001 [Methylocella tundrae]